jgi:hypothetical protein
VPWSANGSDATGNLRVLCVHCNQTRSNFVDDWAEHRKVLPATWWCEGCAVVLRMSNCPDRRVFGHAEHPDDLVVPADSLRWCHEEWWRTCTVVELAVPVLAFCAHCDATAYTRWPL